MVLCSALSHYFTGEKAERRKNLQVGVASWLAGNAKQVPPKFG